MRLFKLFTLWLTFFSLTYSVYAQKTHSGSKTDTFQAEGLRELNIDLDNGFTIEIRGEDTEAVSYTYKFSGNELAYERNFNRADIRFNKQGSRAQFSIRFPEVRELRETSWIQKLFGTGSYEFETENQHLALTVPRDIAIELQTRYSDVDIQNIDRKVTVSSRSGAVRAKSIGADLIINNEYGNNTVLSVDGNLQLQSRSSETVIDQINGTVDARSLYSKFDISNVSSEVRVENRSGQITLSNIDGSVHANADYTEMNLEHISGPAELINRSGSITASDIPGLDIEGEYTQIDVQNITGSNGVNIQNKSGKITLSEVQGPVRISGTYLEVTMRNMSENISISNQSGSIRGSNISGDLQINASYTELNINEYSGHRLQINNRSSDIFIEATDVLSEVSVRNSYGNIKLSLSHVYTGNIFLESSYGKIISDVMPDSYSSSENVLSNTYPSRKISGQVGGNSSNSMQIITRNGDITIQKQ